MLLQKLVNRLPHNRPIVQRVTVQGRLYYFIFVVMKVVRRSWNIAGIFLVVPAQNRSAVEELIGVIEMAVIVIKPDL
ncbi:MAG: hypothetical protein A2W37_00560 [Chloroflexi bacterium RBG_16_63_12]|nr:MAG: hypothetical protein A2W37_00560 [Chloroflexi bacterium RBG_16_63_12]